MNQLRRLCNRRPHWLWRPWTYEIDYITYSKLRDSDEAGQGSYRVFDENGAPHGSDFTDEDIEIFRQQEKIDPGNPHEVIKKYIGTLTGIGSGGSGSSGTDTRPQ